MISLIAAIGKNHELGKDGKLLFRIKEDMQFFKDTTLGHPILMGHRTFESIKRPLPGRTNFVVTHHPELLPSSVNPVSDFQSFLDSFATSQDELFVIGGGAIYSAALPYASTLYLTEIDASAPDADTFFPPFDKSQYSHEIIKKGKDHDLTYTIMRYTKD